MHRTVGGILVLLLAAPALWAENTPKDKDKPATPAEQYKALLAEYQKAELAYSKALRAAKTTEQRLEVMRKQNPKPKFSPKFVALAQKDPKGPVAFDALLWVVTGNSGASGEKDAQTRAVELLVRHHVQNKKLGAVCRSRSFGLDRPGETLLRTVLQKNKNKDVQAEACLALAERLKQQAASIKRIKGDPKAARLYENFFGKEVIAELKKRDPAKLEADSEKFFTRLGDEYLAYLKPERLKDLCQTLGYSSDKGGEALLRAILKKDTGREVQGMACLALAQVLKQRADGLPAAQARAANKLRGEGEKLLQRAIDKFADVKLPFRGTVGSKAKSELFEIRFLAVGKKAPVVEGEDQDGKKFKLSDYRGKVVLLDFWSQY
jgi:hypothetical protein